MSTRLLFPFEWCGNYTRLNELMFSIVQRVPNPISNKLRKRSTYIMRSELSLSYICVYLIYYIYNNGTHVLNIIDIL